MEMIEVTEAREYMLKPFGNQISEKSFTPQTAIDIAKTNKKIPFNVLSKGDNLN